LQELYGGQQHIGQAPLFLTWVADLSRLDRVCAGRGYLQQAAHVENFLQAAVDTAIAAQNAALAAEALGLGICYIGSIRNQPREVIELLGLPRLAFPLVGMTVGWPATPPRLRPRLPLAAVLHWERYDPQNEAALIQQYDQAMIATGIYRGRQVTPEDPLPESEYGWSEHSARRVAQISRPFLRQVLHDQGFELK
jgi:FMN reductase (NADPH)